jgi:protein-disulfide isomerase
MIVEATLARSAPRRWKPRGATLAMAMAMATVLLLASPAAAAKASIADHVAAKVGGEQITIAEIDAKLARELFVEEYEPLYSSKLHEARKRMLAQMIEELLLTQAARDRGISREQWLAEAMAAMAPINDEQIAAVYEENRSRFPEGTTLDEVREQLRQYLEARRPMLLMAQLREQGAVDQDVPRERIEVEALGPAQGIASAPVTLIEFSDFQCPYCGKARTTLAQLRARFKDDLRIVYRHLPLDFHPEALDAAYASVCAQQQERFWEYHDLLFDNPKELGRKHLVEYAKQAGLDRDDFESCLGSEAPRQQVAVDMRLAEALGLRATPSFFVNGLMLQGALPFDDFEALIQSEIDRVRGEAPAAQN